jgi:hypothetical protein
VARSISELLPRPFGELTLHDVRQIVADVGEERESLFFERKRQVTPASLAKSCAAFANTLGGLLLVGIADEDDELVGVDPIAEPQVWVKDVLRGRLLPLPPFRARWLALGDDGEQGVLLVLVEESTTTPHLLTRQGAIYVRNPGSSDPVPIQDQRRLFDLAARGEEAQRSAANRALNVSVRNSFQHSIRPLFFGLAATGTGSAFASRLLADADLEPLRRALGEHEDTTADARRPFWTQHSVRVERYAHPRLFPIDPARLEGVEVWRDGTLAIVRGRLPRPNRPETEDDRRDYDMTMQESLTGQIQHCLHIGLELLLELGAHGDVAFAFQLPTGRYVQWTGGRVIEIESDVVVRDWLSFELDEKDEAEFAERIVAEVGRAVGIGPS